MPKWSFNPYQSFVSSSVGRIFFFFWRNFKKLKVSTIDIENKTQTGSISSLIDKLEAEKQKREVRIKKKQEKSNFIGFH